MRLLSWVWPVTMERTEGAFGPLQLRWEYGRLVLNTPNANQSFGSLHRVWQNVLEQEIGTPSPRHVLALGLGGGSVVHILRKERDLTMPITVVELDPVMVKLARTRFGLEGMTGVEVITGDATIQVHALRERYDLVLVDLFADLDMARGTDSRAFVQGLRDRCADSGKVCFNTVGYDARSTQRCDRIQQLLCDAFGDVREWRTEDFNRVFVSSP